MHSEFTIKGREYRLASSEEIKALQQLPGSPHVYYGCTNCGLSYWSAKNMTLNNAGEYSAVRNIFYSGDKPECSCHPTFLRCIVPE